ARFAELVTPHDPNRDLGDRLTRALSSLSENDRATVREFYGAEGANPFASPAGAARLARAIAEVNARHPDVLRNFGAVAQELRSRAPNEQFRNLVARSAARDRLR
ncbi:MAG: hypothetical protein ACAI25_05865, partial [Planctomycetota bacterium]